MTKIFREDAPFWWVWTKTGHFPRKFYRSADAAIHDATHLAAQNPGKKFIVLRAIGKYSAFIDPTDPQEIMAAQTRELAVS